MEQPIFIANWKMSMTLDETCKLTEKIYKQLKEKIDEKVKIVLCPSFTVLNSLNVLLQKLSPRIFDLGSQNVFWEEKGAFTGEISVKMLEEVGCKYAIIGHSERRHYLSETDEMVNKKVKTVLKHNLTPIVCVGETYEERQKGVRDVVVARQVGRALENLEIFGMKKIIIAYEPVWVIGTGQAVEPEDAGHSHRLIREALRELFSADVVEKHFNIVYGGSVDSTNIKSFLDQEYIDGVLVGGASLKAAEFVKMIKEII
jgi:triosephosphate isomerase